MGEDYHMSTVSTYEFTLIVEGPDLQSDSAFNALFENGCDVRLSVVRKGYSIWVSIGRRRVLKLLFCRQLRMSSVSLAWK